MQIIIISPVYNNLYNCFIDLISLQKDIAEKYLPLVFESNKLFLEYHFDLFVRKQNQFDNILKNLDDIFVTNQILYLFEYGNYYYVISANDEESCIKRMKKIEIDLLSELGIKVSEKY